MERHGGYCKASMQKGILEKVKIKHELGFVYIASDGKRFLSYKDAVKHEESIQPNIVEQWLERIKGD